MNYDEYDAVMADTDKLAAKIDADIEYIRDVSDDAVVRIAAKRVAENVVQMLINIAELIDLADND